MANEIEPQYADRSPATKRKWAAALLAVAGAMCCLCVLLQLSLHQLWSIDGGVLLGEKGLKSLGSALTVDHGLSRTEMNGVFIKSDIEQCDGILNSMIQGVNTVEASGHVLSLYSSTPGASIIPIGIGECRIYQSFGSVCDISVIVCVTDDDRVAVIVIQKIGLQMAL